MNRPDDRLMNPGAQRRRLAVLRAGIADLEVEWHATTELVHHLVGQAGGVAGCDRAVVLTRVAEIMRSSAPLPRPIPLVPDEHLPAAIRAAERRYEQLLRRHLAHAEQALGQLTRSAK